MNAPKAASHHAAVLRMLRSASPGWVASAYMRVALNGLGSRHQDALRDCLRRARQLLEPGEELQNHHGYGYRILRARTP